MLAIEDYLDELAEVYGEPVPPPPRSLLDLVLLENIAYLASDERREQAFRTLQTTIGTDPQRILEAPDAALLAVASQGILPAHQAGKLRAVARIALEGFGGDLEILRHQSLQVARKALMRFPGIGEPGAEKVLLFGRSHAVLGLDSNGVRVLTRLGVADAGKHYAATFRAVQAVVEPYQSRGFAWLIRGHQLLRQHGHELCRRTHPSCDRCPLALKCAFYTGASRPRT